MFKSSNLRIRLIKYRQKFSCFRAKCNIIIIFWNNVAASFPTARRRGICSETPLQIVCVHILFARITKSVQGHITGECCDSCQRKEGGAAACHVSKACRALRAASSPRHAPRRALHNHSRAPLLAAPLTKYDSQFRLF